jgi:hypothetical protein
MTSATRGFRLDSDNHLNNFTVEPTVYVDETAKLGWTKYAEIINGRFAMIGFVSLLAIEVSIKHDVIGWLGNL